MTSIHKTPILVTICLVCKLVLHATSLSDTCAQELMSLHLHCLWNSKAAFAALKVLKLYRVCSGTTDICQDHQSINWHGSLFAKPLKYHRFQNFVLCYLFYCHWSSNT